MRSRSAIRTLVVCLAAAAALSALGAGPAFAKKFVTEDGNISCLMRSHFVRCDITEHRWTAPPKPASCEFDYGSSFFIDDEDYGFGCVSDATGATSRYPAGTKFTTGANTCAIRKRNKVKCVNHSGDPYGFQVGKKAYGIFFGGGATTPTPRDR